MHSVTLGTGKPVLLIHGFGVDHRLLLPLDDVFDRRGGWERCYVDLPGFGRSAAGPEIDSTDAVAVELRRFVHSRYGTDPFALVGMSFGGYLARHLVAECGDQISGLALLAPVARSGADRTLPPKTVLRRESRLLGSLDPDDARAYDEMAVVQSAENWALFRDAALPGIRGFDRGAADRIQGRYALSSIPEEGFTTFDAPSILITGRQDHVVGFVDQTELLTSYSRMSFAVLDGAGHNVHLDRPDETSALLDGWLDRMETLP